MHAIRLHAFGPPENLRYEEVADPEPLPGEVRIAVATAGVHLLDTMLRAGTAGGPLRLPELPHIPGREAAGVVEAVGSNADSRWLGRRVVAHLGPAPEVGGYASRTVVSVEALHDLSDAIEDEAAVAMVGTGRTALGILEVARLTSEDVVLVTSAAGGIGSLLVQAAGNIDALVVGLAGGEEKIARVRALGAEAAVDYTLPDWPQRVRAALGDFEPTVAIDGVGGDVGRELIGLLAPGGRLVLAGWSSGAPTELTSGDLYANGLTATAALGPRMLRRRGGLRSLETAALAAAASGTLRPAIEPFPLADAAAAHAALESRRTSGKVVLRV